MTPPGMGTESVADPVAPAAGFVVDAALTILEFLGKTDSYVELAPGAAALQLRKVVHPALWKVVAEAARRTLATGKPVRRLGVRFHRDGEFRTVDIAVAPTSHPKAGDSCIEIRFEEVAGSEPRSQRTAAAAVAPRSNVVQSREKDLEEQIAALRRELEAMVVAHDQTRQVFATRLRAVEEDKNRSLAELTQAYAELEANHEELQIAVSDKEQSELGAREERDFIEAVLDAAEALVMVVDRQGRIVRFNRASQRAAGRSLRDLRDGLVWSLIPPHQLRELKKVFEDLTSGRYPIPCENDWLRPDGTRVRIAWSNTVLKNSAGAVTHVIGVGVDVTEQRKAQKALKDSEARSRALVEAAPLGIVAIDQDGRIQAVNAGLERMFGYERAEFLGQPLDILLPERFRGVHRGHLQAFFQHPAARPMGIDMELFGRAKDGREFPIEVGLGHFEPTDGSYGIAFVMDVTEKVQARRTIEQNRDEIRELAARLMTVQEDEQSRIARELHDGLVQQLAALKLDLAILARNAATAKAGLLEQIRNAEVEAGRAAENARVISHELHPAALEQLGLAPALRAHAADIRRRTGIDVRVETDGPSPALPRQTALGLYRIVQEALWNAARHSGASVATVAVQSAPDKVIVEVADQGKGFDFVKVRGVRSLGLISMEERARLIHARLDIDSHPGKGTIIRVTLRLDKMR